MKERTQMSEGPKPNRADQSVPAPKPHPAWLAPKLQRTLDDNRLRAADNMLKAKGQHFAASYVGLALKMPIEERAEHHEKLPRALRDVLEILSDAAAEDDAVISTETWGQTVTRLMNTLSISYEDAVVRALELREPSTTPRQVETGPETLPQATTRLMNHEGIGFEAARAQAIAMGFR